MAIDQITFLDLKSHFEARSMLGVIGANLETGPKPGG
jgi:hypothetical protein